MPPSPHLNILIQVEYQGGGGEEGDAEQGAGRLHGGLPIKRTLKDVLKSLMAFIAYTVDKPHIFFLNLRFL